MMIIKMRKKDGTVSVVLGVVTTADRISVTFIVKCQE